MRGSAWPATWPFLPRGLPTAGWRWRHRCSVPSGRSRVPGCCLQSRGLPAARLPEHACPRCPRCPGCRGSPAAGGREGLRPALPRPVRAEQPQLAAARRARGCAQGARVLLVVQWSPCQVTVGVRWPPRSLVDCTGTISSSAGAGDRQHSPGGGGGLRQARPPGLRLFALRSLRSQASSSSVPLGVPGIAAQQKLAQRGSHWTGRGRER